MKYVISQQPMNRFERMKASPVGMSHICTASDSALPNLDSLAILENLIELYTTNPGVYTQNTSYLNDQ
jgi:hypothetical protein